MRTAELVAKYRHTFNTDFTADANCQGAWLFTEGSGTTVADDSANTNTANFKDTGEPAWSTTVPPSPYDYPAGSVNFDGTNDYIKVAATGVASLSPASTFSSAIWFNRTGTAETYGRIITKTFQNGASSPWCSWDIEQNGSSSGYFHFFVTVGSTRYGNDGNARILVTLDVWEHIAIVCSRDGSNHAVITGYQNGVSLFTPVDTGDTGNISYDTTAGQNDMYVSENGGGGNIPGLATEWGFFDDVLTATEINEIMDNGLKPAAAGSPSVSYSPSLSPSPSYSPSGSPSVSPSPSYSPSLSISLSPSPSYSPSKSPSRSPSSSESPSPSVGYQDYSRGTYDTLPSNNNDLTTIYSGGEVAEVGLDNETYVSQSAITNYYTIHEFKDHTGVGAFTVKWNGQSSYAPSDSKVVLQIWNIDGNTWADLVENNAADANEDFDLTSTISSNLDHYKDGNNIVSCRVYQRYV